MTPHSVDGIAPDETVHEGRGDGPQPRDASSYVLVVDDEPVVRQFVTRCLTSWGYIVKQAGNAAEALEIMVAQPASVVLCDIKMPGQDGVWLAERLRAQWPQTSVVMASALDDLQTVGQCREVGAVDYITKPIRAEQLHQVLRRLTASPTEGSVPPEPAKSPSADLQTPRETKIEAEYTLESPVKCPACGERITTLLAVRLVRAQVNFTSTLPRRGRVIACPHCLAVIPAELTNF